MFEISCEVTTVTIPRASRCFSDVFDVTLTVTFISSSKDRFNRTSVFRLSSDGFTGRNTARAHHSVKTIFRSMFTAIPPNGWSCDFRLLLPPAFSLNPTLMWAYLTSHHFVSSVHKTSRERPATIHGRFDIEHYVGQRGNHMPLKKM
ncbi:MAG: hypothetical protein MZV63_63705 [Marinilabiliales bacterium]|nr:hypothetical protein [Marinilabiliales bacterium]